MSKVRKRRIALAATLIVALALTAFFIKMRDASFDGGQKPVEPFRIAGNLYYVGANDVSAFLITSPQGHVLIDGGYPGTARLVRDSVVKLGFKITDVKVLLNSHAHFDHAGGLAELQDASGAQLWVSEGDADMIASGGDSPSLGPLRLLVWSGVIRYARPRVDHVFQDGDTVVVGPTKLTAVVTPGHTAGCTSWSFPVVDSGRTLSVLNVCGLSPPASIGMLSAAGRSQIQRQLEGSLAKLRAAPVDIFLTPHARSFGRWRKLQARRTAIDPVQPFIDRKGYLAYLDESEQQFRRAAGQ